MILPTRRVFLFAACDKKGEADILMVQGQCEMNTINYQAAAATFFKALRLYLQINNLEGICDARIHLALACIKYNTHFIKSF